MIVREFWKQRILSAWEKAPIVWLSGVRRVGKTTLAQSIDDALYVNCDLPSSQRLLEDPERFFGSVDHPRVILDEVHQLPDPSRLLKIGADAFPALRILATGSSTLAATAKFKDSLTGRKRAVHLTPVLAEELESFGVADLRRRLHRGGLPEPLLADDKDPELFAEWLDSYYARDVQELFRVGKRHAFIKLIEVLMRASGGLAEATNLAKLSGLSRPTVLTYLDVLQATHVVTVLRPFHSGGRQEILRQPKIYGFDTGFVSYCRGWDNLREEDCGSLFEHLVLDTLRAHLRSATLRYWRDKRQREVDFVVAGARDEVHAIECKWSPGSFSPRGIKAFRASHPRGKNYLVSPAPGETYRREVRGTLVTFCNLEQLTGLISDAEQQHR